MWHLAHSIILITVAGASTVEAQRPDSSAISSTPLFTKHDAYVGAAFVAATIALLPLDRSIAMHLQDSATQANHFFGGAATDFERAAVPGAYMLSGALYAIGRVGRAPRVADIGLHTAESVFLAIQLTDVVKGLAGRARPGVVGDSLPDSFQFARGLRSKTGYTSFPSGHTAKAFGAASALSAELTRWRPQMEFVAGPILYGSALMVGLSRMYHDGHWASDVALGAGIGTFSGLKVVRYNHSHPKNRLDRLLLGTHVTRDARGDLLLCVQMLGGIQD